jgi:hypothetical protein
LQPDFKTDCNGKHQAKKKVPLFAEVNISKEDARANKNRHTGGFFLVYDNWSTTEYPDSYLFPMPS